MKGSNLGEFEELVLLMVMILQEEAYVLKIQEELHAQTGRKVAMGALHTTLSRLTSKDFLTSVFTGATQERGGRRKRVYSVSAAGKSALQEATAIRKTLLDQVPNYAWQVRYI
ncbi:MAG: helix-turn-helix transcriptional regulator [Cyclobacteriaceae bacterium]|nr:helix-turn-helix transcriptional regulator [Cyclobacteriaceae bacterium HetDA_MAG_MS6]